MQKKKRPDSSQAPLLEVKGLSHQTDSGQDLLSDINFSIAQASLTLLLGKNGSGKTVLIRHLNGLLKANTGKVYYRGIEIEKRLDVVRQKIGLVFQNPSEQFIGQTVTEDIAFGPENLRKSEEEIHSVTERLLDLFSLQELRDRAPENLSGGEKRRLALAGVLALEPELVVFDEPFTDLDYEGVREVLEEILRLKETGIAVLIACHDYEKIFAHVDRLLVLENGRLVENGAPYSLLDRLETYGLTPFRHFTGRLTWLR